MTAVEEPPAFSAPSGPKVIRELTGLVQIPRLILRAPKLAGLPRGDQTVIAFPGYSTNDAVTLPLRTALRILGHTPFGWGFGVNRAEVEGLLESVTTMVERRVEETGQPAALMGWSNGGIFAREVARDRPDLVGRVITFGTPIFGGPRYTRAANMWAPEEILRIETVVNERNLRPIEQPVTAIYSKSDNIVDWRACVDTMTPNAENIAINSTHAGMMIDPDVWTIVAERLA